MKVTEYWNLYKDANGEVFKIHYEKNDAFTLVIGVYDHDESIYNDDKKCLGVYWNDFFPHSVVGNKSEFTLSPLIIPQEIRDTFLNALLEKAKKENDTKRISLLETALDYFKN